jgi:hypothetical protein
LFLFLLREKLEGYPMAGITPAVNPAPQTISAPAPITAAAPVITDPNGQPAVAVNPADPTQVVVDPNAAALPVVVPTIGPLIGGATAVGLPGFSQTELMVVITQLMQNLGNVGKGSSIASSYLQSSGSFSIAPLEQGVKVHQQDDSEYFQALGYEA